MFGTIGIKADQAYQDLQQFENSVQQTATGMQDRFQQAGESINQVGTRMQETGANMSAGMTLPLAGIGMAAMNVAADFDTSTRQMQASLGLTEKQTEELGKVAKETWKEGYGASLQEVDAALVQVYQNMKDVPTEELESATQSAMTLAKTFDSDINEVTRGAGQLMNQFGLESKEAFDLLAAGGQAGLNFSKEMFDNISEYSPLFKQAGFTADEMFTILANGTKDGAYNLDYINDLVKEFGIRVQDGSKGVTEAFAEMSPETQKVWDNFNQGKGTAADVFNAVLADLGQMEDKVKANQLGVAIFGTKWEDMGAEAVLGLNNVNGALGKTEGAMNKMEKASQEAFSVRMQKVLRETQAALEPVGHALLDIAEVVLPPLAKAVGFVAEAFGALPKPIQIGIAGFLALVVVMGPLIALFGFFLSSIGSLVGAFGFLGGALAKIPGLFAGILKLGPTLISMFSGIGKAIALLGRSMMTLLLNPWSIAILAIIGLVYLIYKNWDSIVKYTQQAVKWIGDICGKAWDGIVKTAKAALDGLGKFFSLFWEGTKNIFSSSVSFIGKILDQAWKGITKSIQSFMNICSKVFESGWNIIKKVFSAALNAIKTVVRVIFEGIKAYFSFIIKAWQTIFRVGWNVIKTIFTAALNAIKTVIRVVFEGIKAYLSFVIKAWQTIFRVGWNIIKTIFTTTLNFIKNFIVTTFNFIKNTINTVMNLIKGIIQAAWNFIKDVIIGAVRAFANFVVENFNRIKNVVTSVLETIKNLVVNTFSTVRKAIIGAFTGIVETVQNVFSQIGNIIKNVAKDAFSWGADIVKGIGEGMSSMFDWVVKKAKGIASGIAGAVKDFFGIKSPSRLMMGYGNNITEGIAIGMEKMVPLVDKASAMLNAAVIPPGPVDLTSTMTNQIGRMGTQIGASPSMNSKSPAAQITKVEEKTDKGVIIQNATFKVMVEQLQSAEDIMKMRKAIQNVVADDLMGMAVRNL
ncbi:phage tail tape measure protein [Bacillus manliponensis]